MHCPYCESETKVVDSRDSTDNSLRRRRECLKCKKRFTTYERIETTNLLVIKKDGAREQFNRDKLKNGIIRACEKRPITLQQIDRMVEEIETGLLEKEKREVESKRIGELVMEHLQKIDKISYIRFASVYREFADIESFEKELQQLLRK
ncbi:transcriptional repressor NrdR [Candidatus Woesearchaeota archaeon]|nr:transcriptional repressor NrdR [Candidatus Woesearchaeota archaeon]